MSEVAAPELGDPGSVVGSDGVGTRVGGNAPCGYCTGGTPRGTRCEGTCVRLLALYDDVTAEAVDERLTASLEYIARGPRPFSEFVPRSIDGDAGAFADCSVWRLAGGDDGEGGVVRKHIPGTGVESDARLGWGTSTTFVRPDGGARWLDRRPNERRAGAREVALRRYWRMARGLRRNAPVRVKVDQDA